MVTTCLTKVSSYLPSFSEESRAYYKGMAAAGTVFAAGAFLGWNTFINQTLFSWQNAVAALVGAYTFSGKSISVFPDFQSRVERLHKEIAEASPAHIQQNLETYRARCLALGRELVRMPKDKRTYYQTFVLVRMKNFLLADSKSRPDIHDELIKLYAYEIKMKAVPNAHLSYSYHRGVEKVVRITGGLCLVVGLALARGLVIGLRGNVDDETVSYLDRVVSGGVSFLAGFGSLFFYEYYTEKKHLSANQQAFRKAKMEAAVNRNDIDSLKQITGTKNHKAFQECTDISTFFRILFPTTTSELPKDWEIIVKAKLPKDPALEKFEREADQLLKNKQRFIPWTDLCAQLSKTNDRSVNTLVELLKEANPLFKRAWELAGKPNFKDVPKSVVDIGDYNFRKHDIRINKELPAHIKVEYIIFEIFNALQRSSLYKCCILGKDQNEEALLLEWIESFTENLKNKILHSLGCLVKTKSFPEFWKEVNRLQKNEAVSQHIAHAERYRISWMIQYISDHPEFLPSRLQELR